MMEVVEAGWQRDVGLQERFGSGAKHREHLDRVVLGVDFARLPVNLNPKNYVSG